MNKKVSLNVDVEYVSAKDLIVLTSKDDSIKKQPFYVTLKSGTSTHETLMKLLRDKGVIESAETTAKVKLLSRAEFNPPKYSEDSNQIKVGVDLNSDTVSLSMSNLSGVGVYGMPGSGKTIFVESFLNHAIINKNISVLILDNKYPFSEYYEDYENVSIFTDPTVFALEVKEAIKNKKENEKLIICTDNYHLSEENYCKDMVNEDFKEIIKWYIRLSRSNGILFVISSAAEGKITPRIKDLLYPVNFGLDNDTAGVGRISEKAFKAFLPSHDGYKTKF